MGQSDSTNKYPSPGRETPITAGRPSQRHRRACLPEKRGQREREAEPGDGETWALQRLVHEPSGHRCRESLRNSLWVAARGVFASGRQGRLSALEFAGPQAKPQAVARSQGSRAGSADAELVGFSRNYREQGAPGIFRGDSPDPESGDNLRWSNSDDHSALLYQKCLGAKKGPL